MERTVEKGPIPNKADRDIVSPKILVVVFVSTNQIAGNV
jgi:hypothetical protein